MSGIHVELPLSPCRFCQSRLYVQARARMTLDVLGEGGRNFGEKLEVELFICVDCGRMEWFADEPERRLRRLLDDPASGVEVVEVEPTHPYRSPGTNN